MRTCSAFEATSAAIDNGGTLDLSSQAGNGLDRPPGGTASANEWTVASSAEWCWKPVSRRNRAASTTIGDLLRARAPRERRGHAARPRRDGAATAGGRP